MYYLYILYSSSKNSFYIGTTSNLRLRFKQHNKKMSRATKYGAPWKLIYYEAYRDKKDALVREQKLKHHGKGFAELKKRFVYSLKSELKGAGQV